MAKIMQTARSNEANRMYSAHFEGIGVEAGKETKTIPVLVVDITHVHFLAMPRWEVLGN